MATKKLFKNIVGIFFTLLITIPINVLAYSNFVYVGGENIGVELNTKGVIVVGLYKVENLYPGKVANLKVGDIITKINNKDILTISEMVTKIETIEDKSNIKITYLRRGKEYATNLKLEKQESGIYKTGLYVKDKVTGIGTLTFIDPSTNTFGALGHEVIEASSGLKLEIKDGTIYKSVITNVTKSERGYPGEKNATYFKEEVYGNIKENKSSGIYGNYIDKNNGARNLYKVGGKDSIKIGSAKIRTVIKDEKIEEFEINIIKLDLNSSTKNILFEVIDPTLLEKTGGVIAGMSGSPIIQDDLIIGAVSHVLVDSPNKGYGILITTMLEESEN